MGQLALNSRHLGFDGGVHLAFNGLAQFFKHPFGRIQFWRIGWLLNQRHSDLTHGGGMMPPGAIPDYSLAALRLPVPERSGQRLAFHVGDPTPSQPADSHVHGKCQVAPATLHLAGLADFHPPGCPYPAHVIVVQADAHLIAPGQLAGLAYARGAQSGCQAPFFHASWAAGEALTACGRGTFWLIFSRASSERIPQ